MAFDLDDTAVERYLSDYGKLMLSEMRAILAANNKEDSNIYKNIDFTIDLDSDMQYQLKFLFPDYAIYVDKGRRAGKQPPLDVISKWCSRKGIPKKAAFPIARNIGKFGLEPTNFISPIMESKDKFLKGLEKASAKDVENMLRDDLND